jgi:uncharacterized protein
MNAMDEQKDWMGRGWAYPVRIDPATGVIATSAYEQDIREAIVVILGTSPGERVMRPDFGCGIHDLVFGVIDVALLTRVETAVREALMHYEARIEVQSVRVDPAHASTDGLLVIELEYRVRRTNQTGNLVYPFYFREGGLGVSEGSRS